MGENKLLCRSLVLQSQECSLEGCSTLPAFGESGCSPLVLMSVSSLEVSACANVTQMLYESLITPLFKLWRCSVLTPTPKGFSREEKGNHFPILPLLRG